MDELKKLLGEQLYAQVKSKIGERGLIIDTGMLIPKHRFDCINVSLKEHKQLVSTQSERIAELERVVGEIPPLKRRCEELEDEVIILNEIGRFGVKNIFTVRPLIKTGARHGEELKKSVDKQMGIIKSEQAYLFNDCETYMLVPVRNARGTEINNG